MNEQRPEDQVAGAARGVVTQGLEAVESTVDTAVQDVVHEARAEAQQVVDQTLNRLTDAWQQQRPRIEQYMAAHPWLVLGGLLLIGYVLSNVQRPHGRS